MKYNFSKIEKKWQKVWREKKIYEPDLLRTKRPFYNLMMFPYPSAEGLHVGNMYAFTGSDIYGRFKRMQGYDVFEPIGLDGFGIHSENYAIKIGVHPMTQSKISEKRFYQQLKMIGNGFAWDERLETYNPNYYKWTQWIFVQMFKHGLAYRKKQGVNWCPSCKTVLADEQALNGKCERCGTTIIKKDLKQWFLKITKYAERLLQNLNRIDWPEKVKIAQKNWIGRSEGALIKFPIKSRIDADKTRTKADSVRENLGRNQRKSAFVEVFTTRPDTLFGATYLVLAPEHPLLKISNFQLPISNLIENWKEVESYIEKSKKKTEEERIMEGREKTGVELKGIKAVNPANGERIPVWVADYVLTDVGTGAIMAVPGHDGRDFEFAKKYNLEIKKVILPVLTKNPVGSAQGVPSEVAIQSECWVGNGELINSGKFDGMDSKKARWAITEFVGGKQKVQYRLRDWLISRQRYWGVPIPVIFCEACKKRVENSKFEIRNSKFSKGELENPGWIAVPEKDLPVKLPFIEDFRPKGKGVSPLASVKSFYEVKCPACGTKARRETDVSDTFLDSAWYYLGYLILGNQKREIKNKKSSFSSPLIKKWLPVNMYIGGAEHAVLHLLYVRFLAMALHDMKLLHFEEPFPKFRAHGLLISRGAKMSKSKGNVVNPDDYIKKFGADALRMYLMFLAPLEQGGDFQDRGILGITRFLERIYKFYSDPKLRIHPNPQKRSQFTNIRINNFVDSDKFAVSDRLLHKTIKKVTEDIETLHYNTAISSLMILLKQMEESESSLSDCQTFLKLLAPFAPFISEELWHQIGQKTSIHKEKWPVYNPAFMKDEIFKLIIQINGVYRHFLEVPANINQREAENLASQNERVKNLLKGQKIKKIIFVPNRLINFVVD